MKTLLKLAVLAASLVAQAGAQAQDWPRQPIRIVVGFAAGGAADQLARLIGPPLKDALGQPVIVENKPGAGGNLAGELVARAPADGYTLLMGSGGMVSINPHLYAKMAFNPLSDLLPLAAVARVPFYLVVRNESPVKDFRQLAADLKANPGVRTFGSPGNGSSPHLSAELMVAEVGTTAVHVPYKGAAPALTDLLAGQIDFLFDPGTALPHVKAGKLRVLAVGSPRRTPQMPELPTLEELGLKGFDTDSIFGLYAPAGTPPAIVAKVQAAISQALKTPATREAVIATGSVPEAMTTAEFTRKMAADSDRFGRIVRQRGIKLD